MLVVVAADRTLHPQEEVVALGAEELVEHLMLVEETEYLELLVLVVVGVEPVRILLVDLQIGEMVDLVVLVLSFLNTLNQMQLQTLMFGYSEHQQLGLHQLEQH
jgi:hypothetical protein